MKNLIKSLNLFEIIWLISIVIILVFSTIFFPDLMFEDKTNIPIVVISIISILCSPIVELLIAKQCRWWTIFSIFFVEITDIIVLSSVGLFSSAFISLFFWIPFDIFTFVRWSKNKDEVEPELTKVKKLAWWQDIIIALIIISVGSLLGFIYQLIPNSEQTYVVAFSNVFEIFNGIFLLLRYNEQWFAWFGYLICEIVVWIMAGHYIMLITVFAMIINTIYGIIKWLLYIKKKKNIKISNSTKIS